MNRLFTGIYRLLHARPLVDVAYFTAGALQPLHDAYDDWVAMRDPVTWEELKPWTGLNPSVFFVVAASTICNARCVFCAYPRLVAKGYRGALMPMEIFQRAVREWEQLGGRSLNLTPTVGEVLIEAGAKNPRLTEIEENARRKDIDVRRVATNALDGVAGGLRHQGVVARYAAAKTWNEDDLPALIEAADGKALLLVLDGVQDPHNLGACLRTADAAGVQAVIVPKDKSATLNATVRKVACGAAEVVPLVAVTNLARTLEKLQQQGLWIVGTAGEATQEIFDLDLRGPSVLVMGAEGKGMRRLTREHCDYLAKLPMGGIPRMKS